MKRILSIILSTVLTICFLYGLFSLLPDEEGVYEVGFLGGLILWLLGLGLIDTIEEFFYRKSNYNEFVNHFGLFLKIVFTIIIIISASDFMLGITLLILNFLINISTVYYFLSAIIVLLVMILIRLNANK